jgi:hypothetical protein
MPGVIAILACGLVWSIMGDLLHHSGLSTVSFKKGDILKNKFPLTNHAQSVPIFWNYSVNFEFLFVPFINENECWTRSLGGIILSHDPGPVTIDLH